MHRTLSMFIASLLGSFLSWFCSEWWPMPRSVSSDSACLTGIFFLEKEPPVSKY